MKQNGIIQMMDEDVNEILNSAMVIDMNNSIRMFLILSAMIVLPGITNAGELPSQTDDPVTFTIHVSAGAYDRLETVVTFHAPRVLPEGIYTLTDEAGSEIPLQIDAENRGWFILSSLSAGESAKYALNPSTGNPATGNSRAVNEVKLVMASATVTFMSGERKVLSFYHSENDPPAALDDRYKRGGYIHPVYSPSGVVLTNHLNPDQHPHHSGIWSAWTNTEFEGRTPDFWNLHGNSGRVDIDTLLSSWQGPVHGGFTSRSRFVDLSADEPVVALNEYWEVRVFATLDGGRVNVFDLEITQTVNTGKPLVLPEYHYGGIGFRGHKDWDDPEKAFFLTPDGLGRDGHGTRARWVHIGGYTGENLAGLAILGHPSNYRFPQTTRIHPDEPFFNFAPTQLGDMSIQPGKPFKAKYRYITYDGEPDPERIERFWRDYACPPGVTITE